MKVCDVVLNSVWYDPRVRKQLEEYKKADGLDISCVGFKCQRYDVDKINVLPCKTVIADIDENFKGRQKNIFKKLKRERERNFAIRNAIIAEKPDIIHANDLNALIPAFMAKKKLGCKLLYDSHEINVENHKYINRKLYKFIMEKIERYILKRVDLMICVSNAAAEYFQKKYKMKNKPMVITNCALQRETLIETSKKNEGFEVLNHGQFYEGRGYDIMVEAAPYLNDYPDIKITLRGFGTLEENLKQRAEELATNNIIFYPKVLVQELIPMAAKSHVGVAITEPICLNFKLSVSNKLFEYAAAGLPVIMSDIPEHRYLNEKYHFGIILEENTPECFAEAVKKLYLDKEFYDECAKNAKLLSAVLNWENEFNKLIQAEEELLNGKE